MAASPSQLLLLGTVVKGGVAKSALTHRQPERPSLWGVMERIPAGMAGHLTRLWVCPTNVNLVHSDPPESAGVLAAVIHTSFPPNSAGVGPSPPPAPSLRQRSSPLLTSCSGYCA